MGVCIDKFLVKSVRNVEYLDKKIARHQHYQNESGQIVVLLNIFLNKGTSDCVINLSPFFTIFSIPVNNDTVRMSHHFGCHGHHFGVTIYQIIKLLNGWRSSNTCVHHCVIHHWKTDIFSILSMCGIVICCILTKLWAFNYKY